MEVNHYKNSFEFWIDSIDIDVIEDAKNLSVLHGVTTNPTLLSKGAGDPLKIIKQLLEVFDGPLAVQVTTLDYQDMVHQAKSLRQISDRIIVKIPCIQAGYRAMRDLRSLNIPVMATAIYTIRQYILASAYGAQYAAPYFNRMVKYLNEKSGCTVEAYQQTIETIKQMLFLSYTRSTKILLAAIDSPEQLDDLLVIGARYATLRSDVYQAWMSDFEKTIIDLSNFQKDWKNASYDKAWLE